MTVLVTGAGGRIGRRVCSALDGAAEVRGFDAQPGADGDIDWVEGDLLDFDRLVAAARGCTAIVHLAAIPQYFEHLNVETCRVNVLGTTTVFEAAVRAGVPRVIQASSICAAGFITSHVPPAPPYAPFDEACVHEPDDMYGLSKRFAEKLAVAYERRYGLETTSFRIASVAFPDDPVYDEFMTQVFSPASDGDRLMKDIRWQYIDARDVARAVKLAVAHDAGAGVCNVGAHDTPGDDWRIWLDDVYPEVPRPGDLDPALPLWSIERASHLLGFRPTHTWREYPAIADGVRAYLERR